MVTPEEIGRIAAWVETICRAQGRQHQANPELIEEVCGGVLERVLSYLQLPTFTKDNLEHYVKRTAKWEAKESYRWHTSRKTRSGRTWFPLAEDRCSKTREPLEELIHAEERDRAEQAIGALSPRQRDALLTYCRDVKGLTVKDLARLWNCDPAKVYYLRAQALEEVRQLLGLGITDPWRN